MANPKSAKKRVFFVAKKDAPIFDYLKNGKKNIETRAATVRNVLVQAGDIAVFICNKQRLERRVKKVSRFKSISMLLKTYPAKKINPAVKTDEELISMYRSFPGYKEKIRQFGILAFELD